MHKTLHTNNRRHSYQFCFARWSLVVPTLWSPDESVVLKTKTAILVFKFIILVLNPVVLFLVSCWSFTLGMMNSNPTICRMWGITYFVTLLTPCKSCSALFTILLCGYFLQFTVRIASLCLGLELLGISLKFYDLGFEILICLHHYPQTVQHMQPR